LETIDDLIAHCGREAEETATALKKAKCPVLANLPANMADIANRYAKLTTERNRLLAEVQVAAQFTDADTLCLPH
jgi:hypothetical protein